MCGDTTLGAMAQAFTNWAEKHPENWGIARILGVISALQETWRNEPAIRGAEPLPKCIDLNLRSFSASPGPNRVIEIAAAPAAENSCANCALFIHVPPTDPCKIFSPIRRVRCPVDPAVRVESQCFSRRFIAVLSCSPYAATTAKKDLISRSGPQPDASVHGASSIPYRP